MKDSRVGFVFLLMELQLERFTRQLQEVGQLLNLQKGKTIAGQGIPVHKYQ